MDGAGWRDDKPGGTGGTAGSVSTSGGTTTSPGSPSARSTTGTDLGDGSTVSPSEPEPDGWMFDSCGFEPVARTAAAGLMRIGAVVLGRAAIVADEMSARLDRAADRIDPPVRRVLWPAGGR
jgi:hypothetical protein